jgi:hypothetical protein
MRLDGERRMAMAHQWVAHGVLVDLPALGSIVIHDGDP